jgi:hypothetical protein
MASKTPPVRPIPSLPGAVGAGLQQVGGAVNEASLKQVEKQIADQIYAENEAKGLGVVKVGVDASPEDLKQAAAKAKAALNLPSVGAKSAEKGAQGMLSYRLIRISTTLSLLCPCLVILSCLHNL